MNQILIEIQNNLNKIIQQQQTSNYFQQFKKTCIFLNILIKNWKFNAIQHQIQNQLYQCMKLIKMIVSISDPDVYGHRYSYVQNLIKKYQKFTHTSIKLNKHELYTHQSSPNNTTYNKTHNLHPITTNELSLLQSSNLPNIFNSILQNQLFFHNNSCLSCTQLYISTMPLYNINANVGIIGGVECEKIGEFVLMMRYVNGVCNGGGGVLVVGVQFREKLMYPIGVRFKNQEEILVMEEEIITAIKLTRPDCRYQIQRVPVYASYSDIISDAPKQPRLCFKIFLQPVQSHKINYIEIAAKGYKKQYQILQLKQFDKNRVGNKDGSKQCECEYEGAKMLEEVPFGRELYSFIHKRYRKKILRVKTHENVECFKPLPYQLWNFDQENLSDSSQSVQNPTSQDDIKFPYSRASLLAVTNKKDDRHIKDFLEVLLMQKQKAELIKPFPNTFLHCSRSIWMLSHQSKPDDIKEHFQAALSAQLIPKNIITLMPVHRILQINRSKLSEYNEQQFNKKYRLKYPAESCKFQSAIIYDKNKNQKTILYLSFNNQCEAIYAYLIFEELNVRPIFIRCIIPMKNKGNLGKKEQE